MPVNLGDEGGLVEAHMKGFLHALDAVANGEPSLNLFLSLSNAHGILYLSNDDTPDSVVSSGAFLMSLVSLLI